MRASPAAIWEACTDPSLPLANSRELIAAQWDTDGPAPGPGARLLGTNQMGESQWSTVSVVTEWEPPLVWSYEVGGSNGSDPASQWWYRLDDHGDGTVTVSQKVRLGPGPSGLTNAIESNPDNEEQIIEGRLRFMAKAMTANLTAIEERAAH